MTSINLQPNHVTMRDKPVKAEWHGKMMGALETFVSEVPTSQEPAATDPIARIKVIGRHAAVKAMVVSGSLAIPPMPWGIVTILPDLLAIWKLQAQMVADIAGAYGKTATLSREQMMYCLFKHAASQAVRDLVVRVGERILVRQASLRTIQTILGKLGVVITQRLTGRFIMRWLPVVGVIGVGAYAFYDTLKVAQTAIEFFGKEIEVELTQA